MEGIWLQGREEMEKGEGIKCHKHTLKDYASFNPSFSFSSSPVFFFYNCLIVYITRPYIVIHKGSMPPAFLLSPLCCMEVPQWDTLQRSDLDRTFFNLTTNQSY